MRHRWCVHDKGALRGAGKRVAVGRAVVGGERAARLHRRHDDALVVEAHPRDMGGAGKNLVERARFSGVGAGAVPIEREVARRFGPDLRRSGSAGAAKIGHRVARRRNRPRPARRRRAPRPRFRRRPAPPPRRHGARNRRQALAEAARRARRRPAPGPGSSRLPMPAAAMSAAVSTASTPAMLRAAAVSIFRIAAKACGERTNTAWAVAGARRRRRQNGRAPVSSLRSSSRGSKGSAHPNSPSLRETRPAADRRINALCRA